MCKMSIIMTKHAQDPIIQIAGIIDMAEAELVVEAGANVLGFPLRLPQGGEDLGEDGAREIIRHLPADVSSMLITYLDRAEETITLCDYLGVNGVQLHGTIAWQELRDIRRNRPDLFIIKSLVVRAHNYPELKALMQDTQALVDAFITDTFDPQTGRCGATGCVHDWGISRSLAQTSPRPVILAGGLTQANVRQAILEVHPAGVDSHTGVEGPDGRKDASLVRRFVSEAKAGFRALGSRAS